MPWSSERAHRWLLALVGGIFIVYAFGVLVDATALERQAGIAAAAALVGYAALATWTSPPRVRWPLLAGVAVLAVAVYANLPAPASGAQMFVPDDTELANELWQRGVARTRWIGPGLLLAATGGLVAVLAHPPRRRWWALAAATGPAVLAVGSAVHSLTVSAQRSVDRGADLVAAVWLPVLAGLVAFALAIVSTQRGTRGWPAALAALGAMMLAIVALGCAVDTAVAMPMLRHDDGGYLVLGYAIYTGSRLGVEDAMTALATLTGPLLIVLALKRRVDGT